MLACLIMSGASAQLQLWNEVVNGGVITGGFSLGTSTIGSGTFQMPVPPGSTIHKAVLYATEVGGAGMPTIVKVNTVPYFLDPSNAGPSYNTLYGQVTLHSIDLTAVIDPSITTYTITVPLSEESFNVYTEYYLIITYEQAGAAPVSVDLFFADHDSELNEAYTLHSSAPMMTGNGVAFATMASYAFDANYDCEDVAVNGTLLGTYKGGDFNAASDFGTSGTFLYAADQFIGLGDDDADQAIHLQDVVSDLSALLTDGATSFDVNYHHCPGGTDGDNLINLMVLAYSSNPCAQPFTLGPDIALCSPGTVLLDATRTGATYDWQDNSTNATFTAANSGTYSVQVTAGACTWRDTIVVQVKPLPTFELGADVNACDGDSVLLSASSLIGTSFIWQVGTTGPLLSVDTSGMYSATALLNGCSWSDSVRVTFEPCEFTVQLPNVFTPNHDGSNATFTPITITGSGELHVSIFNRWGQEMFSSRSPAFAWDGTSPGGNEVPAGVYFWVLEYTVAHTGDQKELHGTVTVLR